MALSTSWMCQSTKGHMPGVQSRQAATATAAEDLMFSLASSAGTEAPAAHASHVTKQQR
jgi:hypothetical protein